MWADVDKRIRRAMSGVRQAFRGVLTRVNSGPAVQLVQADALAGERLQDAELFQHYGLTSHPPAGTMAVILPVGGKTSHGIVIATEHGNYRLKSLKPGEVALYTDEGAKITLKRGRLIEAECDVYRVNCKTWEVNASNKADFNTPALTASAVVTAQGQINGNGGMAVKGGTGTSFEGDVSQTGGSYTTNGDVVASGVSLKGHKHNGDSGGVTSVPI
ncbi:phage baseplate assembly protein V [Laribacter hongkongensis]|uniref:phage baseplate assembly protein V n=1 Tax=Laribacter hongkongensis TaxID=168471 RepID=UPI001EFC6AD5|nr:phage baseplate assembly protein V [Laribacter hongkongensis]MCG8993208.1 phage baseplate assembly protein V [Laribacter hongkongensis]MCG8997973.1 phage baseplate assembly protein V [Laribacter hongkongensis]MCG9002316.1 phage baseplate assembly protein V [Laribacter hongkongensis]MCG9005626.1 phage baseplate assembly protein V [Laribacter hongkongensis]MCG9008763.1 phage baseplate assembly protein V [Laribacter hongkongensis]